MSMKIKLQIDTYPNVKIEGYVSNDSGYAIRDLLHDSMIVHEASAHPRQSYKTIKKRVDALFYHKVFWTPLSKTIKKPKTEVKSKWKKKK